MIRSNNHVTIELPPPTSLNTQQNLHSSKEKRLTASGSDWETIRTPSLFTRRSPSLNVPLCVLQQITQTLGSLQIHTRRHLSIDLLRKRERERDRYKNLVMDCSPAGGIESLRLLLNPPFFISSSSSFFSSSLSLFSFLIFSTQIKSHYIKVRLNFMRNHGD